MLFLSIILALTIFDHAAYPVTIEVPNEISTITAALNAAAVNDTVLVHPGFYSERLIFPDHDAVLISDFLRTGDSLALDSTIIDAAAFANSDTASVLTFNNGNTRSSVVAGFTLTGGHGRRSSIPGEPSRYGGAIFMNGASATIHSCKITGNTSTSFSAMEADFGSPLMSHCLIHNNCGEGGLVMFTGNVGQDPAIFEWNDVYNNYACGEQGPYLIGNGVTAQSGNLVARFNHFHDAEGLDNIGVLLYNSNGDVYGNVFERLSIVDLGDIIASNQQSNAFRDNVFRDCSTARGICVALGYDGHPSNSYHCIVENNWFENISGTDGPTCFWMSHPNAEVRNNVFFHCIAGIGPVQLSQSPPQGCDVIFEGNQFFFNQATGPEYLGSAFTTVGDGPPCSFLNNWFEGNEGETIDIQLNSDPVADFTNNYWGDHSGPYHPTENPGGQGDSVPANVHVAPWLTEPPNLEVVHRQLWLQPEDWTLEQAYPNPFNAVTNIRLIASKSQPFELVAFDMLGRRVSRVWQGVVPQSTPAFIHWNGADDQGHAVASGVYFLVAIPRGPGATKSKNVKVVLLR